MIKNKIAKILLCFFISLLLFPDIVLAVDIGADEIQLIEEEQTSICGIPDVGKVGDYCYFNYSNYAMGLLVETEGGLAFKLSSTLVSPTINRLDVTDGIMVNDIIVNDNKVKCKKNIDLFADKAIRAGLGSVIVEFKNVIQNLESELDLFKHYYYSSLAMSELIYNHTKDEDYKVNNVNNSIYLNYLAIAEKEATKAASTVPAKIDGEEIEEFGLKYDSIKNIWVSKKSVVFENMKLFTTFTDGDYSKIPFNYFKLTNKTTGQDYSKYVSATLATDEQISDNDLAYQFSISGVELSPGEYLLEVGILDTIRFQAIKDLYSCSSETYPDTKYAPVLFVASDLESISDSVSNNVRAIEYSLTSDFIIKDNSKEPINPDEIKYGAAYISLLDKKNNQILSDASFKICTTADCQEEVATSTNGIMSISSIPIGDYYIVITDVPGYEVPSAKKITIMENNTTDLGLVLEKIPTASNVSIQAIDENGKVLENTVINVCKTEDCKDGILYSGNGIINEEIPFGEYYLSVTVPDGYVKKNVQKITLNKNSIDYNESIKIIAKTEVPNTLADVSKVLSVMGILGIIGGCLLVYYNGKKQEQV